jgi:hypothetical protein
VTCIFSEVEIYIIYVEVRAGIATGYGLDGGIRFSVASKDFSVLHSVQTGSGAYPASYTMGTGGTVLLGIKWPGRDANHSPPSSVEVKNGGLYLHSPILWGKGRPASKADLTAICEPIV